MPSPLLTALAPATLTILGIGATVVALQDEDASVTTAVVWVDAPFADAHLEPGDIAVLAHASTTAPVEAMELVVDGDVVATDDDLLADGEIVVAQLVWAAEEGIHELVVRTDEGLASAPRTVMVGDPAPADSSTTTTTAVTGETTTTLTGGTTTTLSQATTSTAPSATTTAPPTTQATTTTPTTAKPPPPAIGSGQILANGPYGSTVCGSNGNPSGYTDVRVTITGNVTSAQLRLFNDAMGTVTLAPSMTRTGDPFLGRITWNSTLKQGSTTVSVVANGPGGSATKQIGVITILDQCPKD